MAIGSAGESSGFDLIDSTSQSVANSNSTWVQIAPAWDYEGWEPPILKPFIGSSYSEASLRAHIRNLKAHGFKVFLLIQTCCNEPSDAFTSSASADATWWDAWYAQIENFILFHATLAEEEGVDAIALAQGDALFLNAPTVDRLARWAALLDKWRLAYSGAIGYDLSLLDSCCSYSPPGGFFVGGAGIEEIAHLFDFFGVSTWAGIANNLNPTQNHLDINAEALFSDALDPIFSTAGKPIIIIPAYASYDGGAVNAIPVDPVAVASGEPEGDSIYPYDGIEQAMIYQAIMKAVAKRPHITGVYPFGYNWVTMPLAPIYGIRGKAAEKVLAEWYAAS